MIAWIGAASSPTPAPVEADGPSATPGPARPRDAWLRLDQPARRDEIVRSRAILVRGEVGSAVREVWLTLESRTGKIIATHTVHPASARDATTATFEGRFLVGMARPTGRMFVTATAVGRDGVPVAATRRRIEVGPMVEAAAVSGTHEAVVRGRRARTSGVR